ncbi:hypothetical protein SteCoe_1891 [Stentor coeruleus]|uniref:RING-type domain-containing protein n=1 Tax=Stentor coeruleus TaxID=5963 RepID=A0A1R2D0T1_9CILI|nr:hypothetical protein SteCoe_1891 [Stentor coeruleus]
MPLLFLLIQLCLGEWEFLSPDNLVSIKPNVAIANFGNPQYLNTFAKLVYTTPSNCEVKESFSDNQFALVYLSYTCSLVNLARTAQSRGALGVIMVANLEIVGDMMYAIDYLDESISIDIPALVISKSLGDTLKKYSDKDVVISYNYKKFPISQNPSISIMFTSNYTQDKPFIESLKELIKKRDGYMYLKDISVVASSLNTELYDNTTCIYYDSTKFVCVPSSDTVTGFEKLKNTVVIINFFNSLTDISMIDTFFNYLSDLYSSCANDYKIECNQNILLKYGTFNDDAASLKNMYKYSKIISRTQIAGVDVFWSDYIEDAYCLSRSEDNEMCGAYSGSCTYSMLMDDDCSPLCNNAAGDYDNLMCLKVSTCYSFLLNNGQCEVSCPDDSDCDKSDSDSLLLVKILVPIFGFLLLIGIGFLIYFYCKYRNTKEASSTELSLTGNANRTSYRKETFNDQLRGNRDNTCTLCFTVIEVNDECIVMTSGCTHFFHTRCFLAEIKRRNNYCCPQCNEDPIPSLINPHEAIAIPDNRN